MKTAKEIQLYIFNNTGIKTSIKKGSGSNKGYLIISPMFQNGRYPEFPFNFRRELLKLLPDTEPNPSFAAGTQISVFGLIDEREEFKKESKPKPMDPNKLSKGWGSKNSQMRLDKATARNAVKMRKGNTARYY